MAVPPRLHHWRIHAGAEVDLLLERDGRFFPIEINLRTNPTKKDCRGIAVLRETYPDLVFAPGMVICMAPGRYPVDRDVCAVRVLGM